MDKKLISNSLIYSVLTFLQPLSSFILLPLYLNRLQPEEYAVFTLMTNFSAFISLISAVGIGSSVINFYFNYYKNPVTLQKYISGIINFSILCNGLFLVLILFIGPFFFRYFFNSSQIYFYPFGILSTLIGCISTISTPYLIFLKNSQRILRYTVLLLITITLTIYFQVFFLVNLNLGIYGLLWAKLIGVLVPVIIIVSLEFKTLLNGINFKIIKPSFHFALNYLPTTILAWANSYIDRFIVENTLDLKKLGVYSLLLTFTSMIEMVYLAIGSAVQPILYDLYSEYNQTRKINFERMNRVLKFFFHFNLLALSALILLITNIGLFLSNQDYLGIKNYVTISGIGFFIGSYIYIFILNIFYYKKTKVMLLIQLLTVSIIILLDFLLIPYFGIYGAVFVSLFSKLVLFTFSFFASQKIFKIDYDFKSIFLIPFLIISLLLFGNFIATFNFISWNSFGIIQFVTILVILSFLNYKALFNGKKLLLSVFIP